MVARHLILCFLLTQSGFLYAQKIIGDMSFLSGETTLKIGFTYENLIIGDDVPEEKYVAKKVGLWEKKQDGMGQHWENMWVESRETILEPAFRKTIAERTGLITKVDSAPYTMVFAVRQIEPGWTVGVIGCVGIVSGEAIFFKSDKPDSVLARIKVLDMRGKDFNGGDFEFPRRVRQAYIVAANFLSWPIKKAKKKRKK
jgi:hypothetical protein